MTARWPLLICAVAISWQATTLRAANWPAWRGPSGVGLCSETDLPVRWSATENIKWKTPLPDAGNSTPIVWANRVFLTQATDGGSKRSTLCFDRANGKLLWQQTVPFEASEPSHNDNPYCSASPVTDGRRVIVSHGSAGVYCYDLEGKALWHRDLGTFRHIWGNASSPVLHEGLCILNCGPGPRTFLIALDKRTGKTKWKVDIPGGLEGGTSKTWTGSWSTPIIVQWNGPPDLVVSYPHAVYGYHPRTGKPRWQCNGLGRLVYTSPVAGEGTIFTASGFLGPSLALRAGGLGDVTESHRLWRKDRAPQRIGSGVITGGHIYLVNDPGAAECIELRTGKSVWKERVGKQCWSSLVLAGDRLYGIDGNGTTFIFRAAPTFEQIAANAINERTRASIAVSEGDLFIRTYEHLWCIGHK